MPVRPFLEATSKGLKEYIRKLIGARQPINERIRKSNQETLEDFVRTITTYPPETSGNRPPPPYWSRGVGRIKNLAGDIDPVSQKFGADGGHLESWSISANTIPDGAVGKAETDVTYAPWVVGSTVQARWHRGRWKTVSQVAGLLNLSVTGETIRGIPEKFKEAANDIVRILSPE